MPVTANSSEALTADGTWTLIAIGGTVLVSAIGRFEYAFRPTSDAIPPAFRGHYADFISYDVFQHSSEISDGQRYWIKAPAGTVLTVYASDPA